MGATIVQWIGCEHLGDMAPNRSGGD
jgi:hypothetical protein